MYSHLTCFKKLTIKTPTKASLKNTQDLFLKSMQEPTKLKKKGKNKNKHLTSYTIRLGILEILFNRILIYLANCVPNV